MTRHAFVFNGDADGLCALQQMRLENPGDAQLVTGVKREQGLLERIDPSSVDKIMVLDLPLPNNRAAAHALLDAGKQLHYFDHHRAGELPQHPNFHPHFDFSENSCTSLIVDRALLGKYRSWAIVGAFGDELDSVARTLARQHNLSDAETMSLAELGRYLNYNSYGDCVDDLHFAPTELARRMMRFVEPLDFVKHDDAFQILASGYRADLAAAQDVSCDLRTGGRVYFLPDQAWARRVTGTLANDYARQHNREAIAIIRRSAANCYSINLRVPRGATPAGDFCSRFKSGGGRALAGGINCLEDSELGTFLQQFDETFGVSYQRCNVA